MQSNWQFAIGKQWKNFNWTNQVRLNHSDPPLELKTNEENSSESIRYDDYYEFMCSMLHINFHFMP